MNMMGYTGDHAPDLNDPIKPENVAVIRAAMEKVGEL